MHSSPASKKPEPTMADLLESGRDSYAAKRYRQASQFFRRAIRTCPCTRGPRRVICSCLKRVAAKEESIIREALLTCHCSVGQSFSKCDNPYHIQALDSQAATYEALGELYKAMKYAAWMVELAPQLPDGYLRVGRIARLQKKYEYAWKIYTAGIKANEQNAAGSSAKLQILLHRSSLKQDPFRLPAEIVTQIFSYLDFREILVCFRVCKNWERTLTSPLQSPLWRDIIFQKFETEIPRLDLLRKMLLWAGDGGARKIVISRDTEITQPTLTLLLEASPRLEYLKIGSLQGNLTFPSDKKTWDRLRHVSIGGSFDRTPVDLPGGFPQMFLQNAARTLEHLNLVSIPKEWYKSVPSIPVLPKLKTLLIHGFQDAGTPFTIYPLSIAFPRLEQLYINSLFNLHPEPVAIWRKEQENIWPHLKVLIFQPHVLRLRDYDEARTHSTLQYLTSLNSGNSLQHIQFRFDLHCNFDFFPHAQFQNLRSLRSKTMWMSPDRARTLLSNAVRNKKLNSFDIVFPNPYGDPRLTADACVRHLEGYEWLRGTPTIHTLGCQDFYSSFDPEDEDGRLLPQFLATFPNLRTLIITTPLYYTKAELAKLILAILKATQLKTIYVRYFTVETFGWLEEAARSKGTKIIEGSEPSIWPIPLDQ